MALVLENARGHWHAITVGADTVSVYNFIRVSGNPNYESMPGKLSFRLVRTVGGPLKN